MANKILCLCGSGRNWAEIDNIVLTESLRGWIVIGFATTDRKIYKSLSEEDQSKLIRLHFDKIRLCHEVLFINQNGYVGETGKHQIAYALAHHKRLRFFDTQLGNGYLETFSHELAQLVTRYTNEAN